MQSFRKILYIALIILSPLLPLAMYFWGNAYHLMDPYSIAMVFGIISYIYFLNALILSTRLPFLDRLIGQDKLIQLHRKIALVAIILAFAHRKFKAMVFTYTNTQMILGNIALWIMLVIIALTVLLMVRGILHKIRPIERWKNWLTSKKALDYNILKGIHNVLVLAILLASFHVLLASSTGESWARILLMGIWPSLATILWIHHRWIKPIRLKRRSYEVKEIRSLNKNFWELTLSPKENNGMIPFKAGQFAYFRFPGSPMGKQEHPFTISSSPDKRDIQFTSKIMGDFTSGFSQLQHGQEVWIDGPYGRFTVERSKTNRVVLLAGGIGITPFLSMLKGSKSILEKDIWLFWTVKTQGDLFNQDELRELASKVKNFHFYEVISRDKSAADQISGRLDSEKLNDFLPGSLRSYSYFLCGPNRMMGSLKRILKKEGVPGKNIFLEDFGLG